MNWTAWVALVAGAGLTVSACSSSEEIGKSSERLTTVEPPQVVSTSAGSCGGTGPGIQTSETSGTWYAGGISPSGAAIPPAWLVGSNTNCSGFSANGLARAVDSSGPLTWTFCGFGNGCGAGGGAVPMFSGGGVVQQNWRGDPFLASTRINYGPEFGLGGDVVAYVSLADSNQGLLKMVVAAISFDGGQSFAQQPIYVNQGYCDDGVQDQPAAAFDSTVFPPRLWVTWRHKAASMYGVCTQWFDIDPVAGQVLPQSQPPQEVHTIQHAFLYGPGGLIIRAQNHRATIVYSDTDHPYTCPSGPIGVAWWSTSSDDGGLNWFDSVQIRNSSQFAPCLANNNVQNQMRTFGFVNDNLGDYYAAFPVSKDQIEVWRSKTQGDTWFNAPVFTVFDRGGNGSRIQPFLASDGPSRIGLHYYETDVNTDMQVTPMFVGAHDAANFSWDPPIPVGPPFTIDTANGNCQQGKFLPHAWRLRRHRREHQGPRRE